MLSYPSRFVYPLGHSVDARRINDRMLAIIHFAGSANRDRAARYVENVLEETRTDEVDGVMIDFSEVNYVFANNSTFTVLGNFLYGEQREGRFARVVPGPRCKSGLGVLVHVHPHLISQTVEDAVDAFAAMKDVV